MHRHFWILAAIVVIALPSSGCTSRRRRYEQGRRQDPALAYTGNQRAEAMGRFNCDAYNPSRSYESSGRAKPESETANRFAVEREAQRDALRKLFVEAATKCRLDPSAATRGAGDNLRIESSRVLSETPDGTVNVTVSVSGRDILESLEIAAQGGYGEPAPAGR